MKVLGFNFTKISAERFSGLDSVTVKTKIDFEEPKKEKVDFFKDQEIFNFPFSYNILYEEKDSTSKKEEVKASILFKGVILLSGDKEETKDMLKNWKSKEHNSAVRTGVINTIIQRCTIKALSIEEDLGLPPHLSMPKITLSK